MKKKHTGTFDLHGLKSIRPRLGEPLDTRLQTKLMMHKQNLNRALKVTEVNWILLITYYQIRREAAAMDYTYYDLRNKSSDCHENWVRTATGQCSTSTTLQTS